MRASWRLSLVFLFLSCLFLFSPSLSLAQVDRGGIVGLVTDPGGARVPGAQVTVSNLATNQSIAVTTDEQGHYAADLLRIGTYSVTVEKPGFQRAVQSSVEVGVNQTVRIDIALSVGSTTESVQVTAAPPLLQTEASSLGTIETERRISELPLNGRNFIQLAYLGPGANGGQTGTNVSGGVFENERANEAVSVNGLRVSNNNFLLNGVDNNEFGLGGVVVLPPPDAIQEFRTEENSMSAEFGRGGAAVNVVLKSGTNQIHGGAYEFIRNDKLDAVNYFNQGQQPFKRNQFGAFLGGPLKKNRTFIFGDYEGSRLRESNPFISTVPTAAERAGDFSDRLTGETFSPCATPSPADTFDTGTIFDPFSTHDYTCADGGTVSLRNPISSHEHNSGRLYQSRSGRTLRISIPHANLPGTHQQLSRQPEPRQQPGFFRYQIRSPLPRCRIRCSRRTALATCAASGPVLWGLYGAVVIVVPAPATLARNTSALGFTHTFSPQLLNDLHGGYFRYAINALPFNFGKSIGTDQLGIPNANRTTDPNSSGLTNIDIAGFTPLGDSLYLPEHAFENIYQIADTLTWIRGRHSLKFGVDFRRQQRNFYQVTAPRGFFDFGGVYTNDLSTANGGNGLADAFAGHSGCQRTGFSQRSLSHALLGFRRIRSG
jgi:hypothetical protein